MSKPMPSVSIVIAAYNRGPRISKTLDSVIAQTVAPAEILVIDDGSTDETAGWIHQHYPTVTVASFENAGTSAARNRGAAIARGDVLVFLDNDDEILPIAVQTLLGLFERFPSARAAFADHTLTNLVEGTYFANHHVAIPSFHRMRDVATLETDGEGRLYGRAMHRALLLGNLLQQPWAVYRDAFARLGGFDEGVRLCEDWELYLRVARNVPLAVSDRVISNHFIEGQNLHRAAGQEVQQMNVLRKHIRATGWADVTTLGVLRRRLGGYYKAAGDQARDKDPAAAWHSYLKSFAAWPFDHVVASRCVSWSYPAVRQRLSK